MINDNGLLKFDSMNTIKIFTLLLFSLLILSSCNDEDEYTWTDIPNSEVKPVTAHNKVIYEVNVSLCTAILPGIISKGLKVTCRD